MTRSQPNQTQERLALSTYVKLMRAANSARGYAARSLGGTNLTLTQFAVLEALYHLGPMSLSQIARKVLTTGGNLTMVVGNLEKLGLAKRQRCPEDRRVLIVVLTAKGKTLIRDVFPKHADAIAEFLGVLSSEEQECLGDLCRKLGKQSTGSACVTIGKTRFE
ncbi:MAG: MarR family transcriptional regulator [Candidatus Korobacteraceae bacterium]